METINHRIGTAGQWGKEELFFKKMGLGQLVIYGETHETSSLSHTIYKNQFQMVRNVNVKLKTYDTIGEKIGQYLQLLMAGKDFLVHQKYEL